MKLGLERPEPAWASLDARGHLLEAGVPVVQGIALHLQVLEHADRNEVGSSQLHIHEANQVIHQLVLATDVDSVAGRLGLGPSVDLLGAGLEEDDPLVCLIEDDNPRRRIEGALPGLVPSSLEEGLEVASGPR